MKKRTNTCCRLRLMAEYDGEYGSGVSEMGTGSVCGCKLSCVCIGIVLDIERIGGCREEVT